MAGRAIGTHGIGVEAFALPPLGQHGTDISEEGGFEALFGIDDIGFRLGITQLGAIDACGPGPACTEPIPASCAPNESDLSGLDEAERAIA